MAALKSGCGSEMDGEMVEKHMLQLTRTEGRTLLNMVVPRRMEVLQQRDQPEKLRRRWQTCLVVEQDIRTSRTKLCKNVMFHLMK